MCMGTGDTTWFALVPPNPPNDGILFVDHSKTGRSGHLGHALVEYAPGKILAFYPNCSDARGLNSHGEEWAGHNGDGWMEYKRSEDGGRTWSEPVALAYSKRVYDEGKGRSVMCEKAVRAADGAILLFNLECDISTNRDWGPAWIPTYLRSVDGGHTWTEARALSDARGRVFDALFHDEGIFALQRERVYALQVSTDQGESFSRRSELPWKGDDRCYGTMAVLHDGSLIVYAYNPRDEQRLDRVISPDGGFTWGKVQTSFFEKKIRNPQMAAFRNGFVLHGRSGGGGQRDGHLVLYASRDGLNWDAGRYLRMQQAGAGAYTNNLVVGALEPDASTRLLIQASHAYELSKTNVLHWWLEKPPFNPDFPLHA